MKNKLFRCKVCGNIVEKVEDSGVPIVCCGEDMEELVANTTDGAGEKHVPVCRIEGNSVHVTVGEVEHPMADKHYIQWIGIQTKCGMQRKFLKPMQKPQACFALCDGDEVVAIYEYCNLHGLWAVEI